MIDTDKIKYICVSGLKKYLSVPVIQTNQNAEPPEYPYLAFTITTLESENSGTYGEYDDGISRKAVTQIWSISALSNNEEESITLASKAREYLEYVGKTYLNDNGVIVERCSNITNRDNFLSVGYEYKNGFDVTFWAFTEIESPIEETGIIESVEIGNESIIPVDRELIVTENGRYEVTGYKYADVNVPIPEGYYRIEGTTEITKNGKHNVGDYEFAEVNVPERKEEQEKTVEITKNGTTEILPDGDKVLSKATVNVNVPIPDGYIKPEGSMPITENGTFDVTEKAEVNVQVVAKPEKPYIDSSKLKYGAHMFSNTYGTDLSLLENLDTSEMETTSYMFYNRKDLTSVPELNLSNVTDFSSMFAGCINLVEVPDFDFKKAKNMTSAFNATAIKRHLVFDLPSVENMHQCFRGSKIPEVTLINTSKCTNFSGAFMDWYGHTVHSIDTSNTTNFQHFCYYSSIVTIEAELDFSKATNVNLAFLNAKSLKNIKFRAIRVFDNNLNFSYSSNLTAESLLSILNALSDNSELATTYTVHLGSANIAKLTFEQLSIAYDKNIDLD